MTKRAVIDVARSLREMGARIRPLLVVLGIVLAAPVGAGDSPTIGWDPGYGATLPGGMWIAGDVTVEGEVLEEDDSTFDLDDFSLLARWEPTARIALFGELRLEDLVEVVEGEGSETGSGDLTIERLYAELLVTPSLTLRMGKIFTPYGLWNVVRRAPLTWTVDRPVVTENVFPQHATGLSLLYQTTWQGWTFDATTYGPAQDELTFRKGDEGDLDEDGLLFGGRVAAGRSVGPAFAGLGLNAAAFRPHDRSAWSTVTGLDLDVAVGGHQLSGELTFKIRPDGKRTIQGLYLQDVIPLTPVIPFAPELYGVLRFEQFQPGRGTSGVGGLVGLFWRPVPPVVIRANYLFSNRDFDELQPGFQASLSLLF